ncbi:MAG TPA: glycosyltransferase family 39 protein [Candidatus Acidoferrales bacterium]|nr:glycosyltransferase family 39 protein [Candidatus Acidoferrales bacterium]
MPADNRTPAALSSQRSPVSLLLIGVIVFVNFVAFFSRLGRIGLVGNDEPRYASIADSMSESGDWVTPRLNGSPWFEKPILYYWCGAISFKLFGETDYAARLPSGIAGLIATIAIAWAAKRFYGVAATVFAVLMLPTTVAVVGFARGAGPDMLFASALTTAMALSAEIVSRLGNDWKLCAAFGAVIGLACLAKGPAAIVLAGGAIASWAFLAREWNRAFRAAHPAAIAACAVVAVPWYAICASRNPDFLRTFFFLHNVERFATPVFHHVKPFWYFIPVVLLGVIPWLALTAQIIRDARIVLSHRVSGSRPGMYFACWAGFVILFFSISKSKLPGYVLPAIPALVVLFAGAAVTLIQRRETELSRWTCIGFGLTWLVIAIGVAAWRYQLPENSPLADLPIRGWLVLLAAAGLLIVALGSARRITAALVANAICFALIFEAANIALLPAIDPLVSARESAIEATAAGFGTSATQSFELREPWKFGLEHYLTHTLNEFSPDARLQLKNATSLVIFTPRTGCLHLIADGLKCQAVQQVSPEAWLVKVE